jgi:hypothetical protein
MEVTVANSNYAGMTNIPPAQFSFDSDAFDRSTDSFLAPETVSVDRIRTADFDYDSTAFDLLAASFDPDSEDSIDMNTFHQRYRPEPES